MKKKYLYSIGVVGMVLLVALGSLSVLFFKKATSDLCTNTLQSSARSGDGKYLVYVYTRECGATTRDSTQVSILASTAVFDNSLTGNIFISDEDDTLQVAWFDQKKLGITSGSDREVSKREIAYEDITITYESQRVEAATSTEPVVVPVPHVDNVEDYGIGDASVPAVKGGSAGNPDLPTGTPGATGKIKADVFSGKLEKVDTGCFADDECFVVVGGKHVTAITGMRINPPAVGSVLGVPGFGDLADHIGETVEVYAQVNPDNTYTLYGSEGFYIKLMHSTKPVVGAGCMVGGCSNQLCVAAGGEPVVSTCEYTASYACYKTATCERQIGGQCEWAQTPELKQCIATKTNAAQPNVQ